jgi:hypothetical protein
MKFVIVGTGRCGTTLLHDMLNLHSQVYVVDESFYHVFLQSKWGLGSAPTHALLADLVRVRFHDGASPLELLLNAEGASLSEFIAKVGSLATPETTVGRLIEVIETEILRVTRKRVLGDKTPHYGLHLRELRQLFPALKVIHMVRNQEATALSMSKHSGFQAQAGFGVDDYASIAQLGGLLRIEHPPIEDIQVYRGMWSRLIGRIRREVSNLPPSDSVEISYDELVSNTSLTMKLIADFLGLKCSATWLAKTKSIVRFGS